MNLFERFFFSADLGDGSGGDAGGAAVADVDADAGVDAGVEGGQPEAAPFDYEAFAKPLGGPEGLQRMAQFANDIQNRAHYNPQFRETLEKALRGEFGPAAQQQAEQQTQGGQQQQQSAPWLKYDPGQLSQMQTFHRLLEQAKASGDPQAVKDVWDDPQNAQVRDAFVKHQNEMNSSWFDPRGFQQKMWNDPEMQQMRQQEYRQAIQQEIAPIQEELWNYQKINFYQQNQKAIDALPQHIKDAFSRGVFGDYSTGPGWIKAAQGAMQEAQRLAGGGQPARPTGAVAPNETAEEPRTVNRAATNGVKRGEQPSENRNDPYKKFAQDYVKARQKDEASKKS